MKGVAWDSAGAPQMESAKKAGELISDVSCTQFNMKSNYPIYFLNAISWSFGELITHAHYSKI